jgi:hypothetical protein
MFTSKRALAKICKFISANAHLGSLAVSDTSPPYSGSLYDALFRLIRQYNQKHNSHGKHSYVYYVDCNEIRHLYIDAVKKRRAKNAK